MQVCTETGEACRGRKCRQKFGALALRTTEWAWNSTFLTINNMSLNVVSPKSLQVNEKKKKDIYSDNFKRHIESTWRNLKNVDLINWKLKLHAFVWWDCQITWWAGNEHFNLQPNLDKSETRSCLTTWRSFSLAFSSLCLKALLFGNDVELIIQQKKHSWFSEIHRNDCFLPGVSTNN